ncbi:MAG TPA: hypothetical protein VIU11_13955 [Nakamurella sp.]
MSNRTWRALAAVVMMVAATAIVALPVAAGPVAERALQANCDGANPTPAARDAAVRITIGVAKTMGVSRHGQIVAVMVMQQESSIRNLANDGSSQQAASWTWPGRAYWLATTRLSLRYPHDRFGAFDGAHDTDSIGLYQQRPAYGWGDYGVSNGRTDPAGVVRRLLDPRWEAMAFFGGQRSAAPTSGLLDISGWERLSLNDAAQRVQRSGNPTLYGQWEALATSYVDRNQDAQSIALPWYPGGGQDLGRCAEPLTISLRAQANGRYVVAENGGASSLIANRTAIGSWERYDLLMLGGTRVALRAHANGAFVCAENAGASSLIANRGAVGLWETFTLVSNVDSSVSLRAAVNNRLVAAESAGGAPLIANRTVIGQWEKFDLVGA